MGRRRRARARSQAAGEPVSAGPHPLGPSVARDSRGRERRTFQSVRVTLVRERTEPYRLGRQVKSGADVADLCSSIIGRQPRENFLAVYVDGRHRVLGVHVVSIGTLDSAAVHMREVFAPALDLRAAAVIACHNHPSGDATPSVNDRQVTDRLRAAGELLGVECLDHVVLGFSRFYSFADEKYHPLEAACP